MPRTPKQIPIVPKDRPVPIRRHRRMSSRAELNSFGGLDYMIATIRDSDVPTEFLRNIFRKMAENDAMWDTLAALQSSARVTETLRDDLVKLLSDMGEKKARKQKRPSL